jgi:hypothetical protein
MESSSASEDDNEDYRSAVGPSGEDDPSKKSGGDQQEGGSATGGAVPAFVGAHDAVLPPGQGVVDDDVEDDGTGKEGTAVEGSEAVLPPVEDDDGDDEESIAGAASSGASATTPPASKANDDFVDMDVKPPVMAAVVTSEGGKTPVRRKARVSKAGRKKKPVDMPRRPLSGYVPLACAPWVGSVGVCS